jgi:hypothetical protein
VVVGRRRGREGSGGRESGMEKGREGERLLRCVVLTVRLLRCVVLCSHLLSNLGRLERKVREARRRGC